jgi:hypothetical protein
MAELVPVERDPFAQSTAPSVPPSDPNQPFETISGAPSVQDDAVAQATLRRQSAQKGLWEGLQQRAADIHDPFDPDAFLASLPPAGDDDFDPDAFLAGPAWSDIPGQALKNLPASAAQFGHDIVQPFVHPIETGKTLANVAMGAAEKVPPLATMAMPGLGPMVGGLAQLSRATGGHEEYADVVGRVIRARYGSIGGFKYAIATDPVGVAADLSLLLTGGGGLAARAPGIAGKVGEIAGTVGRAVDPLSAVTGPAKLAGNIVPQLIGGMTHTGAIPLETAARAGFEGGEAARSFRENLRGIAPTEDAVMEARGAVQQMRRQRGDAYRAQMAKVGADNTILSWNDFDTALADMDKVATFKGQSLSPSTEAIRGKINSTVADWKNLRASEFWTPEGFDALKKKIGDIRDATQPHTPERVVADQAYQAIRKTIIDQVPDYAKVMKGYEEASTQIKEIERTLTGKPGTNIETALRRLQSTLRNNVSTAFGRREELAKFLVNSGAPYLMEKLAGQALQPWMPRGLGRLAAQMLIPGAGYAGAGVSGAGALAATMSPRLMGEAAYYGGVGARPFRNVPLRPLGRAAFQAGRSNPFATGQ